MMSGRKKCICQICTCGRHLCVNRCKDTQLKLGDDSVSEANAEFSEAGAKRKTREWDFANGETHNISAAIDQINAQQVLANASQATSITVKDKGNRQVYDSNSGNRWSENQVPKRQIIRPTDHLKTGGETNFTTGYQRDYTQKTSDFSSQAAALTSAVEPQQDSWNQRQIPKTLPIKNPDSLTLSGPLSLETTNKSDYTENVFQSNSAEVAQKETTHRPRTSLKVGGEFQSDSSYQRAFTPKRTENVVKVKKGTVVSDSHLKPEGDMTFDTTSLDYEAAVSELSKWKSENDRGVPIKPKKAKPQSGLKIPQVPLEDETTLGTDYRRWNVGKPERHKPADTLQLGDGITDIEESSPSTARQINTETDAKINDARWHVSRPVVRKPQNNLKTEGDFNFATTHDIDYTSRRSRYPQSNLETLTERSEKEITERGPEAETFASEKQAISTDRDDTSNVAEIQQPDNLVEKDITQARTEVSEREVSSHVLTSQRTDINEQAVASNSENQYEPQINDTDYLTQNGEQMEYVPWDLIRPKPIRPHSNLRQEGGMEFNTTNRSEFVQRSTERVKGIRPQTTTKIFDGDFDPTTMNQIMFSNNHAERVNPIRPKSNLHLEDGQFNGETTTAREYQQWEIKRPSPIVHKTNLGQEGSIDFTTTNRTEFEEKHPEKVYPIRPPTTKRLTGELELTTTNQMMHGSFPIERVQKIVPQSNLRTSSGIFNSETTNRTQFQEYHIDRPKPIKPVPNLRQEGSMDFTTMNQLQFEKKPIDKVSQFRPQTNSKITGDFQGETTNRIMHGVQQAERPQMIKPKGNIELEKGTFASDTTNHLEFQQWQRQPAKPQAVTPRNNLQQEGDMDFTTTNQLQYAGKTSERVLQIRPQTNPKISGEFDGTTTNRIMYQNIQGEKPKPIRPKTNLQMEKGTFGGETTNNREFQSWGYEKSSPIKPHSSIRQEGTMDFTTTNSTQFEGKTTDRPSQIRPTTSTKVTGDFDGTTTNQMMFQNNTIETVRGVRPSTHIQLEKGKFEDQTTARREYQQWELAKTAPFKQLDTLTQQGTMDFTTSNQTEFGAKAMTKTEATRPRTSSPITGKFDATTTNQMMYQAQPIDRVQDIRPRDNLRVQSGEFNGESTSSKEYIYREGTKPEPFKPQSNLSQEGNFDFVTSNQLQYEEKPIERVSKIRPTTHTKASEGKFYGTTTNQAMFQTPAMETVHSVRPPTNLRAEEGTFQGNTTTSDAYQQWKTERPKAFQLLSSLKQEGDMNFETTNKSEFREKSFERAQKIRPNTSTKIEGDFEATTTNQAMFNQKEKIDRVKPIRQQNNLYLEQGKFSDETTTSREYKQWVKNGNKIAVPKKKMQAQAAGISTQRQKPNRRKEISKTHGKDQKQDSSENDIGKLQETHPNKDKPGTMNGVDEMQEVMKMENSAAQGDTNISTSSKEVDNVSDKTEQAMAQQQAESVEGTRTEKDGVSTDISTMKSDYGTKQLNKDIVSAPRDHLAHAGKMNFTTTSKTDYPEKAESSRDKKQMSGSQQEIDIESRRKVTGDVSYESWKLAQSGEPSGTDLSRNVESISMRQQQQTSERKQQSVQNINGPKSYKPPDNIKLGHVPFDATSTSRTEYKKWEGKRSSAKKRRENLKQEGKMQFDTTSNDYSVLKDYPLSMEASRPKIKEELKKGTLTPTGSMEFSTTSKSSYAGVSTVGRAKNLRPRSSLRVGVPDSSNQDAMTSSRSNPEISSSRNGYELTSTSRASYVGYAGGTRTRANRPSTSQKVGEGAFDGQSTTRSTFTMPQEPTSVVKSKTVKPENHNILHTENGFTGASTYKSSFETKVGHCPVIDLDSGKLPLTLKEERNGHLYYAPRVQG